MTIKRKRIAIMLDLDWPLKRHHEVYAGIRRYMRDHEDWECVIDMFPERRLEAPDSPLAYDGVIARATPEVVESANTAKIPLVNVWYNSPATDVVSVTTDPEAVSHMAADYLFSHGFRNFGFLGVAREASTRLGLEAFIDRLRKLNVPRASISQLLSPISPGLTNDRHTWERYEIRLEGWISSWELPIGIFVTYDTSCRDLIAACDRLGVAIPAQAALLSAHNEPVICLHSEPSISSIDYGHDAIGYEAAKQLDQMMRGSKTDITQTRLPPTALIPRQSTNAYAVDDPVVALALQFIAEHSQQAIKVSDVAKGANVTRRTLERGFEKYCGRTIAQEITHFRLERLKRFLIQTSRPLKELARETGFKQSSQMCAVFKRIEGISPSEYRTKHRTQLSTPRHKKKR